MGDLDVMLWMLKDPTALPEEVEQLVRAAEKARKDRDRARSASRSAPDRVTVCKRPPKMLTAG